ncbi:MAG: MBL fold metallo-hydrolase [Christensenellales bacterium]
MSDPFTYRQIAQGVWQIWDPLGVGMTLIAGSRRALLFDAGYGLWDPLPLIRRLCDKPLSCLMSHAHHDHMLGALRLGVEVRMHEKDLPLQDAYTAIDLRRGILASAREKGLRPDSWGEEHYLHAAVPAFLPLSVGTFDLGGLTARVLPLPGHTPGSLGLLVEERGLLLLGDSWNPQTWLFFPECCPLERYRESLRSLPALSFRQVLVSHDPLPRPAAALLDYIAGLDDRTLDQAAPHPMAGYEGISTCRCLPAPDSPLIFDRAKWRQGLEMAGTPG